MHNPLPAHFAHGLRTSAWPSEQLLPSTSNLPKIQLLKLLTQLLLPLSTRQGIPSPLLIYSSIQPFHLFHSKLVPALVVSLVGWHLYRSFDLSTHDRLHQITRTESHVFQSNTLRGEGRSSTIPTLRTANRRR